eukprot:Gb_27308 [translate_table: standard]
MLLFLVLFSIPLLANSHANSSSDHNALLSVRKFIIHDPLNSFANWNANATFCTWTGVKCNSRRHRVIQLNLSNLGLEGSISSLVGNLSFLRTLSLFNNRLRGHLPQQLGYLFRLRALDLHDNQFEGYNQLSGVVPIELGKLHLLELLHLQYNQLISNNLLSGTIPDSFAYLPQLRRLFLHGNNYLGNIPTSLGECRNLEVLDLSHNRFSGSIPPNIAGLPNLQFYLNLSRNSLEGHLPLEIGKMEMVQAIDIFGNRLSGLIPAALESCSELAYLDLSENEFKGPIPAQLGKLQSLQNMDLSRNNLSGEIPEALGNLKMLQKLNLSFNNLTGAIPKTGVFKNLTAASFLGNHGLCGSWLRFPVCPTPTSLKQTKHTLLKRVRIPVVCISSFILAGSLVVGFFWASSSRRRKLINLYKGLSLNLGEYPRISYQELVNATNGFNETNLLGVGSFGSVYKGILSDGTVAAVKVLDLQNEEAHKNFISECKVLGKVRHRNLVKIITCCSNTHFKGLVLQFVSNGSLEKHLYPDRNESNDGGVCRLGLSERVNIAIDIAHGIEYLHYDSSVQVVHCDIKPANVLLDEDLTARVADFGIARLACSNSMHSFSSTLALKGSVGYIAPEYGMGGEVSAKGDVYSYGVLLLEMFTRKRPINEMFVGELNLHKWVRSAFPNRVVEVVDSCLFPNTFVGSEERGENELHSNHSLVNSVLHLGLLCTNESPRDRPTMRDVVGMLDRLRASFVGSSDTTRLTPTISELVRGRDVDAGTSDSQSGSTS